MSLLTPAGHTGLRALSSSDAFLRALPPGGPVWRRDRRQALASWGVAAHSQSEESLLGRVWVSAAEPGSAGHSLRLACSSALLGRDLLEHWFSPFRPPTSLDPV